MEQERDCQTIFFKDLLFCALYQWKAALIIALVLALILGGIGFLGSKDSINLNTATITPEMQIRIDLLLSNKEIAQKNIEKQTKYLEESLLMTIDPFNVYTAGFHVVIYPNAMSGAPMDTYVVDTTSAIIRAYRSILSGPEVMDSVAQSLSMESQYLAELISYDTSVSGCLGISVRGNNIQDAKKISDALLEALRAETKNVCNTVESHSIQVIPFENGPKIDNSLYETQASANQRLTSLKNTLLSAESELSRLLPTELSENSFSPVLLALIGAVLGVALTACFAWVGHIGGEKIYSAKGLSSRTGVRILGCVPGEKKHDRITGWLRKLEGRSSCANTQVITANIRNRCQGVENLLILGQYAPSLLTAMTEQLEASGIHCTLCADPQTDPQALEALPGCDAVLLAATCLSSRYDSIEWTMQTVADQNRALVGCLLIDG